MEDKKDKSKGVLSLGWDGQKIVDPSDCNSLLTLKELREAQNRITATLEYYARNGMTSTKIRQLNDKILNREYVQETEDYRKARVREIDPRTITNEKDLVYFQIAKAWWDLFRHNRIEAKAPLTDLDRATWKNFVDPIRLMVEKDGITKEQFRVAFEFLKISDFWKKNIFSTNKLREQLPRLITEHHGRQSNQVGNRKANPELADYSQQVLKDLRGN